MAGTLSISVEILVPQVKNNDALCVFMYAQLKRLSSSSSRMYAHACWAARRKGGGRQERTSHDDTSGKLHYEKWPSYYILVLIS